MSDLKTDIYSAYKTTLAENAELKKQLEDMNQNCISIGLHNSRMEAREMELEKAQKERDEYRVKAEQLFGYSFEQGVKLHDAVTALEDIDKIRVHEAPENINHIADKMRWLARQTLLKLKGSSVKIGTSICGHGTPTDRKCELC